MSDIELFKLYLLQGNRKVQTVKGYMDCFQRLIRNAPSLSLEEVSNYFISLREQGRKATYINDFIDLLHLYGKFKKVDTYTGLRYFKEEIFVKATLSDTEIERFLSLPPPTATRYHWKTKGMITYTFGAKDYAIWTLFFTILAYSGMRPGEVAHLTVDRVDFGRQVYSLEDTKTNTPRLVPIAEIVLYALQEHIKTLKGSLLFPAKTGHSHRQGDVVDDVDWGYNFHQRLKRLGVKRKNLTVYSLRHSFITRMLDEDINIFKVQRIVGHRQLSTTAGYTHLTTKQLVTTLKKDPLARKQLTPMERMTLRRKLLEDAGCTVVKMEQVGDRYIYEVIEELSP